MSDMKMTPDDKAALAPDVVEEIARAMVTPLGHDPAKDWARVFVGNGAEVDGSLRALCHDLAQAIAPIIARLVAERERIGRERERAEIAAWLRGDVAVKDKGGYIMPLTYQRDPDLAAAIERGDHVEVRAADPARGEA